MCQMSQDEILFFDQKPEALPMYAVFKEKLLTKYPMTKIKVQKTQITYFNRHVYACISFLKVKKKAEMPNPYMVLTLGLPYALESDRVAVKTEPYPGRWTTHFVIGDAGELDDGLFSWVQEAYGFAERK